MRASPIPRSRRDSPIWVARRLRAPPADFGRLIADETERIVHTLIAASLETIPP
jgi:hypothetical protein